MFNIHSVVGRIVIGKSIGFLVGLIVMLLLPLANIPIFSAFGLGTLLMFTLMGVVTGFVGLFDRHPLLKFKMSWWLRGGVIGLFFMLMYILLSIDTLSTLMESRLLSWTGLSSPYWALIDGTVLGMIMGYFETKFAGKGENLPLS